MLNIILARRGFNHFSLTEYHLRMRQLSKTAVYFHTSTYLEVYIVMYFLHIFMHVCSFLLFPLYHYAAMLGTLPVYSAFCALSFLMPDRRGFLRRIFAIAMDVVGLYCLVCS